MTEPVAFWLPVPPLTATVTVSACAVVMLDEDGFTVTDGAVAPGVVTDTEANPEASL
jgi:hypothetical protein